MRFVAALLLGLVLLTPGRASASFLDSFFCGFLGCMYTLDGATARLYLVYLVPPGSKVSPWGGASPLTAVREGTLDSVRWPAAGEGTRLGFDLDGDSIVETPILDLNDNGFLDAGDSISSFGLAAGSGIGLADLGSLRHSFYAASRVPFDIYAGVIDTRRSGPVGAGLTTSDVAYLALASASGVDDGFAYGGLSTIAGFTPEPIPDVSAFDPGPTRVIRFLIPTRTGSGGLAAQSVRISNQYSFSGYDLSQGTGYLHLEVEYAIYRP